MCSNCFALRESFEAPGSAWTEDRRKGIIRGLQTKAPRRRETVVTDPNPSDGEATSHRRYEESTEAVVGHRSLNPQTTDGDGTATYCTGSFGGTECGATDGHTVWRESPVDSETAVDLGENLHETVTALGIPSHRQTLLGAIEAGKGDPGFTRLEDTVFSVALQLAAHVALSGDVFLAQAAWAGKLSFNHADPETDQPTEAVRGTLRER